MNDPPSPASLIAEARREAAQAAARALDLGRAQGVAWSGVGPEAWDPTAPSELTARAARREQATDEWAASPTGRLLAAVIQAQQAAAAAIAAGERARSAAARGLSDEQACCIQAVEDLRACAVALAAGARAARRALIP